MSMFLSEGASGAGEGMPGAGAGVFGAAGMPGMPGTPGIAGMQRSIEGNGEPWKIHGQRH